MIRIAQQLLNFTGCQAQKLLCHRMLLRHRKTQKLIAFAVFAWFYLEIPGGKRGPLRLFETYKRFFNIGVRHQIYSLMSLVINQWFN